MSSEKIQFLVVGLQTGFLPWARASVQVKFIPNSIFLYNPEGLGQNLCERKAMATQGRAETSVREAVFAAILLLAFALAARAQQPSGTESKQTGSSAERQTGAASADQEKTAERPTTADSLPPPNHRFWDRENDLLFAGVGAGRALDYASTLNLRRRGIDEVFLTNSIVDNHPLFAGIEASATAASIGVSYIFHRAGHHRLERWTSAIHFGVGVVGAARNYALKTPHR